MNEIISINIWDDYYEDEYVPAGEVQKTYIHVEDNNISLDKTREYLEKVLDYVYSDVNLENTEFILRYFDARDKFPHLIGTEYEHLLFRRWEIKVVNLSHEQKDILVDMLNDAKIMVDDKLISVYSGIYI